MRITLVNRGGRNLGFLDLADSATVDDLKRAYQKLKGKSVHRQRWTLPAKEGEKKPVVLDSGSKKLSEYGLKGESTLVFKDLGPQIGYSTVFVLEYLGPMLVYPLFYYFRTDIYGAMGLKVPAAPLEVQTLACYYWIFHYAKRIFETLFIHSFSHSTMPIFNLFKNCSYYWGFAAFVSYFVNHPLYTPPPLDRAKFALGLAMLAQAGNFYCHVLLTRLRTGGKGGYQIPRGFLFSFITCANYTCEIYGWLFFNVATQTLSGVLFMLAGAFQMAQWAAAKHKRLRTLFDGKEGREKYPRRWIMLPPFF